MSSTCMPTRTSSRGSSASIRAGWCRCWCTTAKCTSRATTSSTTSRAFPEPKLIPAGHENEVAALLKHEDDLHLDLRTLSFRFVFAPPGPPKPAAALKNYADNGAGTVQGVKDAEKAVQIAFWERAAKEGFTDERARASAQKFRAEFDALDKRLAAQPHLMGQALSVLDIAWFIYANRLALGGYPFARLHPHVNAWMEKLRARPEFAKEIAMPPAPSAILPPPTLTAYAPPRANQSQAQVHAGY